MSAIKTWSLWCDHPECSDADSFQAARDSDTLRKLRAAAGIQGWEMVNAHDFCPTHADAVRPATRRPTGRCTQCPATPSLRQDGTLRIHREVGADGRLKDWYCNGGRKSPREAVR